MRIGAWMPLHPEVFLSRSATSPKTANRIFMIQVNVLLRINHTISNGIGRHSQQQPVLESSYIKRRTSDPSRNKSRLPLSLWEEIVNSPGNMDPLPLSLWEEIVHSQGKMDPLSPSIKEKHFTPNEVRDS